MGGTLSHSLSPSTFAVVGETLGQKKQGPSSSKLWEPIIEEQKHVFNNNKYK